MKPTAGLTVILFLLGALTVYAQTTQWSYGWSKSFMGEKYSQRLSSNKGVPYPEWDPGKAVCPLQPTNALSLARQAASEAFPDVKTWELDSLSLHMNPLRNGAGVWFYEVTLRPDFGDEKAEMVTCLSIVVGLDGHVPEIKKGETVTRGNYADRLKQRREDSRKQKDMTEKELNRQGNSPMPIPLTKEENDRLVREGILPPMEKDVNRKKVQPSAGSDSTNRADAVRGTLQQ